MTPEQKIAKLFAAYHKLSPPVDVEYVLNGLASVEYADIPNGWDAITIRKLGQRPRVVVSTKGAANRKRFTFAHEVGHIVLPWQYGTAICQPEATLLTDSDIHARTEGEANRFAAELLMPSDWLSEKLGASSDCLAQRIIQIGEDAGVSPISASIALKTVYPFPAATWIVQNGSRGYINVSENWPLNKSDKSWMDGRIESVLITSAVFGDFTLYAATLAIDGSLAGTLPAAHSTEILSKLVAELGSDAKITCQINGIIGSANNKVRREASAEETYQILRLRFKNRPELACAIESRLFDDFLRAKAAELVKKRTAT